MSVPICITPEDYRKKAEELLVEIGRLPDKEKMEFLANVLYTFWSSAVKYSMELDGHTGYGR